MDTRELLQHLEKLESGLDDFSFTELKTAEASQLKKSFESFKNGLEEKVFGIPNTIPTEYRGTFKKTSSSSPESQLIANASHEIQTPLNGITGLLDLLKETSLNQEQLELVKAMDAASNNLIERIHEILEFSRLASGQEKFEKVAFHPSNLVEEIAFLCKTLIHQKAVKLFVDYDENIPKSLIGDPARLSQVLLNLIGNAIKFVDKGEIRLEVNLKEEKSKRVFLEFVISDTGRGITNDQLKHIFEGYRRPTPTTKPEYEGFDLGLSIVKEIVEKQQGCIAVSSTLGAGTTFKVVLPFDKSTFSQANQKPKHDITVTNGIAGAKILVLEDDPITKRLIKSQLAMWGCTSYITDNALSGFQYLENQNVDLVLLDMRLPGWDGIQIAKRIRENPATSDLPVIALSADIRLFETKNPHSTGIDDFILKPYRSEELAKKIDKNLNNQNKNVIHPGSQKQTPAALVNLRPLFKECLEQTPLLEEFLRLFEQSILEFIGKTKMHLQNGNREGVGFTTYKITSSLKMLRAHTLLNICDQLNTGSRENSEVTALNVLYEAFVQEYVRVESAIQCEMHRIKNE